MLSVPAASVSSGSLLQLPSRLKGTQLNGTDLVVVLSCLSDQYSNISLLHVVAVVVVVVVVVDSVIVFRLCGL